MSDQLIQPLFREGAFTVFVDVEPMGGAWRASIDQHTKSHSRSGDLWPHDEMKITNAAGFGLG